MKMAFPPAWFVLTLGVVVLLAGTFELPLLDRDEPRFSRATVEMAERGNWVIPYFNGQYRFDKPPLTYWWMGIHHWILGVSEFSSRLHSILSTLLVASWMFYRGRQWVGESAAAWGALIWLLNLQVWQHGRLALADMPMILGVCLAMDGLWNCLFGENVKRGRWILLLIVSLGLGNLTKQMTLIFPLLGAIVLLIDPGKRHFLRLPTFWLGWLCTLLFLAPTLWWNQQHDWITVSHTASHLRSSSPDIGKRLSFFFEFLLAEAFIIGPVLFFASILYFLRNCSEMWKHSGKRFLLLFSFPAIALFLILSLNQRVNPNWPAVFYLPFFLLTTSHFLGDEKPFRHIAWRRFKIGNLVSCGFLNLTLYSMPFLPSLTWIRSESPNFLFWR